MMGKQQGSFYGSEAASRGVEVASRPRKVWRTTILLLVGIIFPVSTATGLQFYFFFEGPSSTGQAGNRYFTGSPRYKNYDCRICHVGDPGLIQVRLWTEPENIFEVGYEPGREYKVRLSLLEELRKPAFKIFSTNNFCVEVLDRGGRSAGTFDVGFPTNPIKELFDPVVLSPDGTTMLSGFLFFELDWEWFWTAPEPGTGTVTFYCGFVDGNGDLTAFNNDVAVLKQRANPQ
jgi:hypothetical protein